MTTWVHVHIIFSYIYLNVHICIPDSKLDLFLCYHLGQLSQPLKFHSAERKNIPGNAKFVLFLNMQAKPFYCQRNIGAHHILLSMKIKYLSRTTQRERVEHVCTMCPYMYMHTKSTFTYCTCKYSMYMYTYMYTCTTCTMYIYMHVHVHVVPGSLQSIAWLAFSCVFAYLW